MKRIVLMVLLVGVLAGCAGVMPIPPEEMNAQRVIEVPDATKSQLFDRSRMWFASAFKHANNVIQYENKENGSIMGKGTIQCNGLQYKNSLQISVNTDVKEGKARITIHGLSLNNPDFGEMGVQRGIWEDMQPNINDMMTSYEQAVKPTAAAVKSDNW